MKHEVQGCLQAVMAAGVPADSVILVLDEQARAEQVAARIGELMPSTVLASDSSKSPETQDALAELSASGRADVVVTWDRAREAARAVRRGGVVCVGTVGAEMPSVTEVVQREVVLVGSGRWEPSSRDRHPISSNYGKGD